VNGYSYFNSKLETVFSGENGAMSATQNEQPRMDYASLLAAIEQTHRTAHRQAIQAVNVALTMRNWLIGYYIVEYEQHGSDRAQYGERLLETLSHDLRQRLGRGFGWRNLEMFRRFYLCYPISQSVIAKSLFSQFDITLPFPSSVSFQPLEWQNDDYFARMFRELPWTHRQ
jgi:hypothetical protein